MQNSARRASIALGVFMAIVLIAGSILPLLSNNSATTAPAVEPTAIPTPTFPPPVTNFDALRFDQLYLHPSGLYTIALPTGYRVAQPNTGSTIAQVNLRDDATLGVIDAYIEKPFSPVTTADLSGRFTRETLAPTWSRFPSWRETNRQTVDDKLIIDFAIEFQRQNYVARQQVWTDGDLIYSVRVLTPDNAVPYLRHVLENVAASIQPLNLFPGTPFDWQADYNNLNNLIWRHPSDWTILDGGIGRPTTWGAPNNVTLRIETRPNRIIGDEAEAASFVDGLQRGATVLSVQPVTRGAASGYAVAYSYQTFDGEPFSGLALLLNQTDSAGTSAALLIANLRFPGAAVDLNTVSPTVVDPFSATSTPDSPLLPGASEEFSTADTDPRLNTLAAVMNTFQVIAPLPLAETLLTPTPTPFPTRTPTPEPATPVPAAESTAEAEMTAEAEVTPEATPAVETTPDAEATAETTAEPGA
jgi:hypothetical protein